MIIFVLCNIKIDYECSGGPGVLTKMEYGIVIKSARVFRGVFKGV